MDFRALIFAAPCILLGSLGWAGEPAAIRVAAQSDSEPKFVAQGAAVAGSCIDIFRAIEKVEPGLKFVGDQQWMPLKRIEAMVVGHKLDAACGLVRSEERIAAYDIPDTPLFSVNYHMLVRADDPVNVKNFDEVRALDEGGVVLVNAGSGAIAALRKAGGLRIDNTANSTAQNIDKLLAGRGRFYYYRIPGLISEIRKGGHARKVRILPAVFDTQVFYMVLGRHLGKETEDKIAQALSRLNEHGELKQIAEKWAAY
jgi:polar amino acid transport system substrate-binding protein